MLKFFKGLMLLVYGAAICLILENIIFAGRLGEAVGISEPSVYVFAGGFIIVSLLQLWYTMGLKIKYSWIYYAVPSAVLVLWIVFRYKQLSVGIQGMLYGISDTLRNVYGINTGIHLPSDITEGNLREAILFVIYLTMMLAICVLYKFESMMFAFVLGIILCIAEAVLNIRPDKAAILLFLISMCALRFIIVHEGRTVKLIRGIIVPGILLALAIVIAMLIEGPAYNLGMNNQKKLINIANNMYSYVVKGEIGVGEPIEQYKTISGGQVSLSEDTVKTVHLDYLPGGTYYYMEQVFDMYDNGTWTYDGMDYDENSQTYVDTPDEEYDIFREDLYEAVADYDMQVVYDNSAAGLEAKIDVVKNFIKNMAEYNTNPGEFNTDIDPVIYFLYYKQSGFCVHFASAAVMAFRLMEVPARYVTGYAIPVSAWYKVSDGYEARVQENYGHAWAEVYNQYTESWILVETTPGYSYISIVDLNDEEEVAEEPDNFKEATEESVTEVEISDETTEANTILDEEEDNQYDESGSVEENEQNAYVSGEITEEVISERDISENSDNRQYNREILIVIAIFGMFFVLIFVITLSLAIRRRAKVVKRNREIRSNDRSSAIYRMSQIIYEMIQYTGIYGKDLDLNNMEDDMKYAEILAERLSFLEEGTFIKFAQGVQAAIYGGVEPDISDMEENITMYKIIRENLYGSLSLRKRLIWKIIRCYD